MIFILITVVPKYYWLLQNFVQMLSFRLINSEPLLDQIIHSWTRLFTDKLFVISFFISLFTVRYQFQQKFHNNNIYVKFYIRIDLYHLFSLVNISY